MVQIALKMMGQPTIPNMTYKWIRLACHENSAYFCRVWSEHQQGLTFL